MTKASSRRGKIALPMKAEPDTGDDVVRFLRLAAEINEVTKRLIESGTPFRLAWTDDRGFHVVAAMGDAGGADERNALLAAKAAGGGENATGEDSPGIDDLLADW